MNEKRKTLILLFPALLVMLAILVIFALKLLAPGTVYGLCHPFYVGQTFGPVPVALCLLSLAFLFDIRLVLRRSWDKEKKRFKKGTRKDVIMHAIFFSVLAVMTVNVFLLFSYYKCLTLYGLV